MGIHGAFQSSFSIQILKLGQLCTYINCLLLKIEENIHSKQHIQANPLPNKLSYLFHITLSNQEKVSFYKLLVLKVNFLFHQFKSFTSYKTKTPMKHLLCLALLLVFLSQTSAQTCNSSYSFGYSGIGCVFNYNFADANCTQFHFQQCVWTQCTQWTTIGNDTFCSRTQTFSNTQWNYCTSKCCDGSVLYPEAYSSINECQSFLNETHKKLVIILSSVFGGIGLIVLIVVMICCLRDRCGCCSLRDCIQKLRCRCRCFRRNPQPQVTGAGMPSLAEKESLEMQQITPS